MGNDLIKHIKEEDFESEVKNSTIPVLIDFWAEWCGPCKMIAPILEELAPLYKDKLKIVKVDVDSNQNIAAEFGIRSIPTLKIFKDGKEVATHIGNQGKSRLIEFIDSNI